MCTKIKHPAIITIKHLILRSEDMKNKVFIKADEGMKCA